MVVSDDTTGAKYVRPELRLTPPSDEVSKAGKCYRKSLLRVGEDNPVIIKAGYVFQAHGVKMIVQGGSTSVVVPIDANTRSRLDALEQFVKEQLPPGEKYKPLYQGENMSVTLSKYCKYQTSDGIPLPPNTPLNAGTYLYSLHVSHVYYGPLQSGHTCCLTMQVYGMTYDVLNLSPPSLMSVPTMLLQEEEPQPEIPSNGEKMTKVVKKRRKATKKEEGYDVVVGAIKPKLLPKGGRNNGSVVKENAVDEVDHAFSFQTAETDYCAI